MGRSDRVTKTKEKKTAGTPNLHLQRVWQGDKRRSCVYQDKETDGAAHTF